MPVLALLIGCAFFSGPQDPVEVPDSSAPVVVPVRYGLRVTGRESLDDREVGRAIDAGLLWLRAHQAGDGRWDADGFMAHEDGESRTDGPGNPVHDIGISVLALLAFLADGHTMQRGRHADVVRAGIHWLCEQQNSESGLFGSSWTNEFIYDHAIATAAVVEAHGLSGAADLREPAQRAIRYLEWHRNPRKAWHYHARDGGNDTSITCWAAVACRSADDFGLAVDPRALAGAERWLDAMTDPDGGRTGYDVRGGLGARRAGDHLEAFPRERSEAMTAAALFVRYFLGHRPESLPAMAAQADVIAHRPPVWDADGSIDLYYWFLGAQAMHQVGGPPAQAWLSALHRALLAHRRTDGNFAGSWDPIGAWGTDGGRVYSTAMASLCLEATYRYACFATQPILPDVPRFAAAARLWQEERFDRFADTLGELQSEDDLTDGERRALDTARHTLDAELAHAAEEVVRIGALDDFLAAWEQLESLRERFGDLEPGRSAAQHLDRLRRDKDVARQIKGAERMQKLLERYDPGNPKERQRLIAQLERLSMEYRDTRLGHRIEAKLLEVNSR